MQVCASRGLPNKQDNPTNIVQTSRAKFDDIWQNANSFRTESKFMSLTSTCGKLSQNNQADGTNVLRLIIL